MNQENINIVKKFYELVGEKNFSSARGLFDSNLEWVEPSAQGLYFGGTRYGPEKVFREVIEPTFKHIVDFRIEFSHFFSVGDHVIALGRFYGRGKMTGNELDAPTAHIWTLRDGKIIRFEGYHDTAKWQDALGAIRAVAQPVGV
jgi:ketosteroid isomerase-like protein